jgi:predicted nucleic acid-binding protein
MEQVGANPRTSQRRAIRVATNDEDERARRQDRLQWAAATWEPLPFDADAARAYARIFAATRAAGQTSQARLADLLIAATAAANELPVYTRNARDCGPARHRRCYRGLTLV